MDPLSQDMRTTVHATQPAVVAAFTFAFVSFQSRKEYIYFVVGIVLATSTTLLFFLPLPFAVSIASFMLENTKTKARRKEV